MSKKTITVGMRDGGGDVRMDIAKLIVSRALITADSGGGKSYLLRRLLEQVSESTQTIVIDPEGEFSSLREIRDMVIVGPGGELPAEPKTAGLLCRRLMELHLSAVINIEELTPHNRQLFVKSFCETMVALPRPLWHPCVVAIDEIHDFAPEDYPSECGDAIASLSTKGRKRGYCLIGATQRISKLWKDVAAGLKNNFMGSFSLDTDIKRAAGSLGFDRKRWPEIRDLSSKKDGEFFSYGPAFNHRGVLKMRGGEVKTTHPTAGGMRHLKPPAPSAKIKSFLGELSSIPQDAETEIADMSAAKKRIAELERDLKTAKRAFIGTDRPTEKKGPNLRPALERAMKALAKIAKDGIELSNIDPTMIRDALDAARDKIVGVIEVGNGKRLASLERLRLYVDAELKETIKIFGEAAGKVITSMAGGAATVASDRPIEKIAGKSVTSIIIDDPTAPDESDKSLPEGEKKILIACAQHDTGCARPQLSILTHYKRRTVNDYLSRLSGRGLIEESAGRFTATDNGLRALGPALKPLPSGDKLREHWQNKLPEGESKIFAIVCANHPGVTSRAELPDETGFAVRTVNDYLSRLTARGVIEKSGRSDVRAASTLFD